MIRSLEAVGFGLGTTELLIILGILLLVFGASRIPELGKSLGSGIRGFQKAVKGEDEPKQLESDEAAQAESPQQAENKAQPQPGGDSSA
jgi:sec-independent protein translocase protein TatA